MTGVRAGVGVKSSSREHRLTARDLLGPKTDEQYVPVRRESSGPIAPESFAGRVTESFGPNGTEDFRTRAANAPIFAMSQHALIQESAEILRGTFGDERHGMKKLAAAIGVSPRTGKNWIAGDCAPDLHNAMKIAAICPEYAGWVRRLIAMHADMDPEFARDVCAFVESVARMEARRPR
jgi:hypothetical protein